MTGWGRPLLRWKRERGLSFQCATERPCNEGVEFCLLDDGHDGPHQFVSDPPRARSGEGKGR